MQNNQKNQPDTYIETSWTLIQYVVDIAREPFLVLDHDLRVVFANEAFYKMFLVVPEETEGHLVYDLGSGQWSSPELRTLLEDILPKKNSFKDLEIEHEFPVIGRRSMLVNARIMFIEANDTPHIIMAMEDVTKQKMIEVKIKENAEILEKKVLKQSQELEARIAKLEKLSLKKTK